MLILCHMKAKEEKKVKFFGKADVEQNGAM